MGFIKRLIFNWEYILIFFLLWVMAVLVIVWPTAQAGEVVTLPKYLVLNSPTTNTIDKIGVDFRYGPPPYAIITYFPIDSNGRRVKIQRFRIQNIPDDPTTTTTTCVGPGDPWELCTGLNTCENDCDETDNSFSDFVAGFGVTLKNRADAAIWEHIQERFVVQDNP